MAPEYNMCILRGCSVGYPFVTVIGDQMAFRWPNFESCVLALRGAQCLQHSLQGTTMPRRRVRTPVEELQHFWTGSHCRSAGSWMDILTYCCTYLSQSIGGVSLLSAVVCSLEHFHIRRVGSGRPRSTDARQDPRFVGAALTARTASRKEIWAHVALAVSPRTIDNRLLAVELITYVSGQAINYTTTPLSTANLMSWKSRLEGGMALCCLQWWE